MSTRGLSAKNRIKAKERPENPTLGQTHTEDGNVLIYVGRNSWSWFPAQAGHIIKYAQDNGWGTKVEIVGASSVVGKDSEGKELTKPIVRVILYIGRNEGPTKNGKYSKGYAYRLMWDTHEVGTFRLVSKYRRTTDVPTWVEVGSVYEIRSIVSLHPVVCNG